MTLILGPSPLLLSVMPKVTDTMADICVYGASVLLKAFFSRLASFIMATDYGHRGTHSVCSLLPMQLPTSLAILIKCSML